MADWSISVFQSYQLYIAPAYVKCKHSTVVFGSPLLDYLYNAWISFKFPIAPPFYFLIGPVSLPGNIVSHFFQGTQYLTTLLYRSLRFVS